MLQGEGILLADLDKYMELSTGEPGEHCVTGQWSLGRQLATRDLTPAHT